MPRSLHNYLSIADPLSRLTNSIFREYGVKCSDSGIPSLLNMDFHANALLNLPNINVFSYSILPYLVSQNISLSSQKAKYA
jgi:hypothetical protein